MSRKVTVISEIGLNWFGNFDLALEMIDLSNDAGVDIVKFQLYRPEEILGKDSPHLEEALRGVPSKEQCWNLKDYCDSKGIEWCASVFHPDLVGFTETLGMRRYKVASRSVKDLELLKEINRTAKPVFMSVGMSDDCEIRTGLETLRDCPSVTLLYCVCNYPTLICELDLVCADNLRSRYGVPVGISSHCPKVSPALAAVARGATVVEHHVVKHRTMEGCDVSSSLTFKELTRLTTYIRELEQMNG